MIAQQLGNGKVVGRLYLERQFVATLYQGDDLAAGIAPKCVFQTLEPRALYSWTPYRDQDTLPIFDTGLPELDMVRLFSPDRYVGGDRISDTNRVAVGLTTRLLETGTEWMNIR